MWGRLVQCEDVDRCSNAVAIVPRMENHSLTRDYRAVAQVINWGYMGLILGRIWVILGYIRVILGVYLGIFGLYWGIFGHIRVILGLCKCLFEILEAGALTSSCGKKA